MALCAERCVGLRGHAVGAYGSVIRLGAAVVEPVPTVAELHAASMQAVVTASIMTGTMRRERTKRASEQAIGKRPQARPVPPAKRA